MPDQETTKPIGVDSVPGDLLENGARFIQMMGNVDSRVGTFVLAWWGWNSPTPWVTWRVYPDGSTEHGHYHQDLREAVRDLYDRVDGKRGRLFS